MTIGISRAFEKSEGEGGTSMVFERLEDDDLRVLHKYFLFSGKEHLNQRKRLKFRTF